MTPVSLKRFRPLVKGPDRFRVRSIQHVPAVAPHVDKAHLEQNAQVFRNRRLLQPQRVYNLPHGPFLQGKIVQDCPPPRLRHRIERIRSCRCPRHEPTLHSHMGICPVLFFPPPLSSALTCHSQGSEGSPFLFGFSTPRAASILRIQRDTLARRKSAQMREERYAPRRPP